MGGGCHRLGRPRALERVIRVPFEIGGRRLALEATVFLPMPADRARHPLVVLNHGHGGSEEVATRRRERWRPVEQARWFTDQGYIVVVPMRRGFAGSEGEYAEGYGSCEDPDYLKAGREAARDLRATILALTAWPEVDPARIYLAGVSAGGFAALTLASQGQPGVRAVLNFAGGRGAVAGGSACAEPRLIEAMATLGRNNETPSAWIYAANDSEFRPGLAQAMQQAFDGGKGRSRYFALPAFKDEGHWLFRDPEGIQVWSGPVRGFLSALP